MTDTELSKLKRMMQLIADGYDVETAEGRYVIVENPEFQPDNGKDPYLVWDCNEKAEE